MEKCDSPKWSEAATRWARRSNSHTASTIMTFPVAALTNDIVAPISQSSTPHCTPLTNMSHHPHLGHRYRDHLRIAARVNNDESPAAKSSNSDRSFPAGPLRSSLAASARARHGFPKVRDTFDSNRLTLAHRLYSSRTDSNQRCRHSWASNRATQRLASIRPAGRNPDADAIHAARSLGGTRRETAINNSAWLFQRTDAESASPPPPMRRSVVHGALVRGMYRLISHCSTVPREIAAESLELKIQTSL